jgi:hypothetical protein
MQKRDKEAVDDCTKAIKLKPDYIKVGARDGHDNGREA